MISFFVPLFWGLVKKFRTSYVFRCAVYAIVGALLILWGAYYLRGKVIENHENSVLTDTRKRVDEAISAGDAVNRDPSRLREDDGFRRK